MSKGRACHGKTIDTYWGGDAIFLTMFISTVGSYVGLSMLQSARVCVLDENDEGYLFFMCSAGLSFGLISMFAMNIIGILEIKLHDCDGKEIHEILELKLILLSGILAMIGATLGSHISMQAIDDVRLGKVTDGDSSSILEISDSNSEFSWKTLFEVQRGFTKNYIIQATSIFAFTLCMVTYLCLLAQYGPFSIQLNYWILIVPIIFLSILAASGIVAAIIVTTSKQKSANLDTKLRLCAAFCLACALELLRNTALLACEKYIYWGHHFRSFTARWNTVYLHLDPFIFSVGSLGFIVFLLMIAHYFLLVQFFKVQNNHDKLTAKLPNNVEQILIETYESIKDKDSGHVADYIPELANTDPEHFAIALCDTEGRLYSVGDQSAKEYISIQSVSKALLYILALQDSGRATTDSKIGEEPSGQAFDKIAIDDDNRASNALINTGAIVSASLIKGVSAEYKYKRFQSLVKKCAKDPGGIHLDRKVYDSEMSTNFNNRDILKELIQCGVIPTEFQEEIELKEKLKYTAAAAGTFGANPTSPTSPNNEDDELLSKTKPMMTFKSPGEVALEAYTLACSLKLTVQDIAVQAAVFANDGVNPLNDSRVIPKKLARHVVNVMMSCGMYNGAGKWIVDVGVPAKSGVGGFLMCVCPGICGIGIFSPRLDQHGNTTRGILVAQALSKALNLHVLRQGGNGGDNDGSSALLGSLASIDDSKQSGFEQWESAS